MNKKNFVLSSIAIFAVINILEFIIHGVFLKGIYEDTAHLWRAQNEMCSLMYLMWIGYLIFAPLFIYIYLTGLNTKACPISQGIKFGTTLGIFFGIPTNLIWYVSLPIPAILAIYWFIGTLLEYIICGLILGLLYKKFKKEAS